VHVGSTVALTVHTQPTSRTVPDVTDLEPDAATEALTLSGFSVSGVQSWIIGTCLNAGTVGATNPAIGSAVAYGSVVSLTLRRQPPGGCEPVEG
jgi:beta-lactam-binding protein with PASTA domain